MEPAVVVSALLPPPAPVAPPPPTPAATLPAARPASPPATGPVVRAQDVGGPLAWQVLVRDGVLTALTDDAAVPSGTPVSAWTRAAALADRVPPRAVAVLTTAWWVYCGGTLGDGSLGDGGLELAYRSSVFRLGAESHDVAGLRVTTPERTALDLASRLPRREAITAAVALARAGADLGAALALLESRSRSVGRPAAREVLRAARDRVAATRRAF